MSTDANERIKVLAKQFTSASLGAVTPFDVCPQKLGMVLLHDNAELRSRVFNFLKDPIFRPNYYLSLMEFRELTLERLKKVVSQRFFSLQDYMHNPRKFMAGLECLSFSDYSMAIKSGVHFTLCGGTICKLGTKKHHDAYLHKLDDLTLTGCYGMTELGHGSNVMGIETTAVYDSNTQEFIINTPNNEASKFWIGGSAQHGKICAVFAQLTINGKWEGPHVFLVRIRDDNLQLMPGVRIKDNGAKMGLNGVDNGQMWFDNVRVPRDSMLDRFASVDASGNYSSSIPDVSKRFGAMVAGLTTGRILIAMGAVDASKIGLTIAIRYACQRPQFGDRLIMSYLTHQRRLLPALACTYALHMAMGRLKSLAFDEPKPDAKLVHVISSGLKAAATWSRVTALQDARECCGGMGVLAMNKIGPMKNDMDVDTTFEGDNTVMMQQVAKVLLDDAMKARAGMPSAPGVSFARGNVTADGLVALLRFREQSLVAQVASEMAKAAASGGPKAALQAFDDNLDRTVAIGWAHIERFCLENMLSAAAKADPAVQPALRVLADLYGSSRVEMRLADYLVQGALSRDDAYALRLHVNQVCGMLAANNGELALKLCDAFGIPDHLLQAPIAFDWRKI